MPPAAQGHPREMKPAPHSPRAGLCQTNAGTVCQSQGARALRRTKDASGHLLPPLSQGRGPQVKGQKGSAEKEAEGRPAGKSRCAPSFARGPVRRPDCAPSRSSIARRLAPVPATFPGDARAPFPAVFLSDARAAFPATCTAELPRLLRARRKPALIGQDLVMCPPLTQSLGEASRARILIGQVGFPAPSGGEDGARTTWLSRLRAGSRRWL